MKPSKLTSQSSAFFRTPEIPCAYSGLAMSRAPALPIASRNSRTARGGSASRSGLNSGSSPSPAKTEIRSGAGARRDAARQNAVLIDVARRLPGMARTFKRSVGEGRSKGRYLSAGQLPGRDARDCFGLLRGPLPFHLITTARDFAAFLVVYRMRRREMRRGHRRNK